MEEIIVYGYRSKDKMVLKADALVLFMSKAERMIPITQIISFDVTDSKGSLRPGQITIRLGGASDTAIGLTSFMSIGRSNNIEFFFNFDSTEAAHRIQDYIASYKPGGKTPAPAYSPADELRKFKELLDIGAITQQEFEDAKRKILAHM